MDKEIMEEEIFNVKYIHDVFCEIMECEPWKRKDFKIISLDETDFNNRLIEEEIENDNNISSLYKYFNDGHITLFVNETELQNNPFVVTETIFSQLFDIYNQKINYYYLIKSMIENYSWIKSASRGYNTWMEFQSSYMSYKLSMELFDELDDNPYEYEDFKDNIIEMLKNIDQNEESKKTKFSVIIYIMGKLASYENVLNTQVNSYFQLKKIDTLDMTTIIEGELGRLIDGLYNTLISTLLTNTTVLTYKKIDKLTKKILNVLT